MHRGADTDSSVPVASLLTTSQQLVHLTKDWHSGEYTCRTVMAILDKQVTPPLPPPPSALTPLVDLLTGAETVYTDGSYKVVGSLLQRIRGTATQQASASVVAKGFDGSYKALRMNLTGKVDSAATAELVGAAVAGAAVAGAAVAGAAGTGHRDQVTDCKSILAIEARARAARPLKLHQRVLLSSAKKMKHKIRWHRSHPEKRDEPWSEDDIGVYLADMAAAGDRGGSRKGRVLQHFGQVDTEAVL